MISSVLRKCHLLLSLTYKKLGGKDVGFTATLKLTLTLWLNALAALLLLASTQGIELSWVSIKGPYLFSVIAVLWGSAVFTHTLLGKRWAYINESRKYLRSLGDKRKISIYLMIVWLLFTYTALFPLSLYLYGTS